MALDTRTVNISLRFPTATASATVRFIPDLASGDAQVLLEKYYDAVLTDAAKSINGATNASPIVITTSANHGYLTGERVIISGVTGNTAANGTWNIIRLTDTTFSLTGSTGNGAYVSGGTVSSTTIDTTIDLPVFTESTKAINYRVQFPRESGVNEHYISLSKGQLNQAGQPNDPIDLSILLNMAAIAANQLALDDLSDVIISSPVSGEYLRYNGSLWVDSAIQAGDLPADVMLKSTYDTNTDGIVDKTVQVVMTVRNDTATTLTVGEVVYVSGASGEHVKVKRAQATTDGLSANTLGMVIASIASGADGLIALHGVVTGVNTNAFNEGDALYLSPSVAGGVTATKTVAPDHLVFVGWVTKKSGSGKIALHIQNGYELDELHNVLITSPVTGQVLTYDGVTELWKNQATAGLTIGNPISGGGANRVLFQDSSQNLATAAAFTYDASNADLTVDTAVIGTANGGARFAHRDFFTNLSYALFQDETTGATYINGANNQHLYFRLNNSTTNQLVFDGTYWSIENNPGTSTRMSMSVDSVGLSSFEAYGTGAGFYFNGDTEVEGNVTLTNLGYLLASTAKVGEEDGDATFAFKGFSPSATPVDHFTEFNYALRQNYLGDTYLNGKSGQHLYFRLNNSAAYQLVFDGTYWTHWYDTDHKMSTKMNSTGKFEFNVYAGVGNTPYFYFNGKTQVDGNVEITNNGILLAGAAAVGEVLGDAALAFQGFSPSATPVDLLTDTSYAVRQDYLGNTYVNAKSGEEIYFRVNNSTTNQWIINSTSLIGHYNNTAKVTMSVDSNGYLNMLTGNNVQAVEIGKNGAMTIGTITEGLASANGFTSAYKLDLTGLVGDWTPGDYRNNKLILYRNNLTTEYYGLGISADLMEIQSAGDIAFYAEEAVSAKTRRMLISKTGGVTVDGDLTVADEAYGSGWNGSLEVPTKNAVYDKIEAMGSLPSLTSGSVVFSGGGTTLSQDNANFFWDDTNNRLGIRTTSPQNALDVTAASSFGQMRLSWDATYYTRFLTTSTGGLSILPSHEGVEIASTASPQFKIKYDASNYLDVEVDSGGIATLTATSDVVLAASVSSITMSGDAVTVVGDISATKIYSTPIVSRVVAGTNSDAAPTPNADTTDLFTLTALSVGATFGAPSGTPVNGQKLLIRIKDNGTARALNWNAAYVAGGASLPTTTVINKTMHLGFIYNTDNSLNKWMLIAKAEEA